MKLNKITKGVLLGITAFGLQISAQTSIAVTPLPADLFDLPYCEVLPNIVNSDHSVTQFAFNTLGYNDCPVDQFSTITKQNVMDAYYAAYGVTPVSATLNGHRFFVIDSLIEVLPDPVPTLTVNGTEFGWRGTVTIPSGGATIGSQPYVSITIARDSTWKYKKDRLVYELIDPTGDVYTMQSFSQQVDPSLTINDLKHLGPKDHLPVGWKYRVRRLEANLDLVAAGTTQIINDYFHNAYQINPNAHVHLEKSEKESDLE